MNASEGCCAATAVRRHVVRLGDGKDKPSLTPRSRPPVYLHPANLSPTCRDWLPTPGHLALNPAATAEVQPAEG
jgi:hypothetical protein